MRIVCDKEKCTGCLACVVACQDAHDVRGEAETLSRRLYHRETAGGWTHYVTESCRHCAAAPCAKVCAFGAIARTAEGWVTVDAGKCVGCRRCAAACPFGIPRFDARGQMVKCDGCGGSAPRCVAFCPNDALRLEG